MELSQNLNILRFCSLFLSTFFTNSPLYYTLFTFTSTILYSLSISFTSQSGTSIILHKCISRVPSTILLVFTTYFEADYRLMFMFIAAFEYLSMWISMYYEVITKEHKKIILDKGPILFADELCWALHDVIFN